MAGGRWALVCGVVVGGLECRCAVARSRRLQLSRPNILGVRWVSLKGQADAGSSAQVVGEASVVAVGAVSNSFRSFVRSLARLVGYLVASVPPHLHQNIASYKKSVTSSVDAKLDPAAPQSSACSSPTSRVTLTRSNQVEVKKRWRGAKAANQLHRLCFSLGASPDSAGAWAVRWVQRAELPGDGAGKTNCRMGKLNKIAGRGPRGLKHVFMYFSAALILGNETRSVRIPFSVFRYISFVRSACRRACEYFVALVRLAGVPGFRTHNVPYLWRWKVFGEPF